MSTNTGIGVSTVKSWSRYWTSLNSPSNLIVTAISNSENKLDWTNNKTGYDETIIERSITPGGLTGYTELDIVAEGVSTYSDTGLTVTVPYYYRIRSRKGSQYSSYTNKYNWWMARNWWALPTNEITLMVGIPITVFGDQLINQPIINNLTVEYTCDIGTQTGNNITFNPVAGDIGNHNLTIVFKNEGITFLTQTISIVVERVNTSSLSKKLMIVADSGIGGIAYFGGKINEYLSDTTFTFVGTAGTDPLLNEGYGGSAFVSFLDGTHGKFYKAPALNIPAYFEDYSIDVPDYIIFMLGANECFTRTSVANGEELTDVENALDIAAAKSLISAFLAYDANVKIIVQLGPLCVNDSIGWDNEYDPVAHNQDRYITGAKKMQKSIIDNFAGGTYNSRVSVGYYPIFVDRDNGYPKVNGLHTTGIHMGQIAYEQMGYGCASALNKWLNIDSAPSTLTAAWENDYAVLDFVDDTGGVAEHEVWESVNGGAYSLVTTLATGVTHYHNYCAQNANMNFKVRAKIDDWYSEFSTVANLATPLVFKTDQTSNVNVVFTNLNITAGRAININWGDGTNNNYSGNNSNVTKTYSTQANPYYIIISGDTDWITYIRFDSQVKAYGDLTKWILPSKCTFFRLQSCAFSGNVTNWIIPNVCTTFSIYQNQFDGTITNFVLPDSLQSIYLSQTGIYGWDGDITNIHIPSGLLYFDLAGSNKEVTGDLSAKVIPATCTTFYLPNNNITKLPRQAFLGINSTGMYMAANSCNQAEIDAFLAAVDTYFATHTPTQNGRYNVSGTGMGVPSAAGLASKAAIEAKYTAAGKTATINVNS